MLVWLVLLAWSAGLADQFELAGQRGFLAWMDDVLKERIVVIEMDRPEPAFVDRHVVVGDEELHIRAMEIHECADSSVDEVAHLAVLCVGPEVLPGVSMISMEGRRTSCWASA